MYIANDCVFPEDWTVETLLKKHRSRPYNPLIASAFFRAGYIESWGRGIEKINSSLSQKEISEQLGVNLNTVKYHVNKLKKANIIKHEGTSQKGNWKII